MPVPEDATNGGLIRVALRVPLEELERTALGKRSMHVPQLNSIHSRNYDFVKIEFGKLGFSSESRGDTGMGSERKIDSSTLCNRIWGRDS
jgi:hypothetical protein